LLSAAFPFVLAYADSFAAELTIERGAWRIAADPELAKLEKELSILALSRQVD